MSSISRPIGARSGPGPSASPRCRARRHRVLLGLVALSFLLAACNGDPGSNRVPSGTYVGRVNGTEALIAVVSDGRRIGGYICDGRSTSVWLQAVGATGGGANLVSRTGRTVGKVRFQGRRATGEVDIAGRRSVFDLVTAEGVAGLYLEGTGTPGAGGSTETGWVVLPDGTEVGIKTQWIDPDTDPITKPAAKRATQTQWINPDTDP